MPEINNEQSSAAREIEELEKRLAEKKAAFETGKTKIEKKEAEIGKENISEQQQPQTPVTSSAKSAPGDDDKRLKEIEDDVRKIKNLDTARQVKVLVALAFDKGITHAISVAKKLNDAYLLDELHDKLRGELHEELVKKGKLKEI